MGKANTFKRIWYALGVLYYLLRLTREQQNYEIIVKLRSLLRKHGLLEQTVRHIQSVPANKRIIETRAAFNPALLNDRQKLNDFPKDSLGYAYGRFLEVHGLETPSIAFGKLSDDSVEAFVTNQVILTHDLWHVVLGYPTDDLGEITIQTFMYSQMRWPHTPFLIAGFIFREMLRNPGRVPQILDSVAKAWARGQSAQPLFSVNWEAELTGSLQNLQQRLGV